MRTRYREDQPFNGSGIHILGSLFDRVGSPHLIASSVYIRRARRRDLKQRSAALIDAVGISRGLRAASRRTEYASR